MNQRTIFLPLFITVALVAQAPLQAYNWPKANWWYVGAAVTAVAATVGYIAWRHQNHGREQSFADVKPIVINNEQERKKRETLEENNKQRRQERGQGSSITSTELDLAQGIQDTHANVQSLQRSIDEIHKNFMQGIENAKQSMKEYHEKIMQIIADQSLVNAVLAPTNNKAWLDIIDEHKERPAPNPNFMVHVTDKRSPFINLNKDFFKEVPDAQVSLIKLPLLAFAIVHTNSYAVAWLLNRGANPHIALNDEQEKFLCHYTPAFIEKIRALTKAPLVWFAYICQLTAPAALADESRKCTIEMIKHGNPESLSAYRKLNEFFDKKLTETIEEGERQFQAFNHTLQQPLDTQTQREVL